MTRNPTLALLTTAMTCAVILAAIVVFILWPAEFSARWLPGTGGISTFFLPALATAASVLGIRPFLDQARKWVSWLPVALFVSFCWGPGVAAGLLVQLGASTLLGLALLWRLSSIVSRGHVPLRPGAGLLLVSAISGLAIVSGALWAAFWLPLNTMQTHFAGYTVLGLLAWSALGPEGRRLGALCVVSTARAMQRAPRILFLFGTATFLTFVLMSLLPELGSDARAAYQGYFEHLRVHGEWHQAPWRAAWGLQPLGGLHLAGSAYLMAGEAGARALNVCQAGLYAAGAAVIAHAIAGSRVAGAAAGAITITTPVLLKLSGDFYYDNAVAMFVTGAAAALALALRTRRVSGRDACFIAFGICLAGAAATKNSAWVISAFLYALAMITTLVRYKSPTRSMLVATASSAVAMSLLLVPVIVAAYLLTGNPVFPYYNQIFLSDFYPPNQHRTPHEGFASPYLLVRLVFDTQSISSHDLRGSLGAGLLLSLPAAAAVFARRMRVWLIVLLGLVATLATLTALQNDLRLLWPVFPALLAVATGIVLAITAAQPTAHRMAGIALSALCALQLLLLPTGSYHLAQYNVFQAIGVEARSQLARFEATENTINAMLDGLSPVPQRRLFLSTSIGPSGALNFEDGWYTVNARNYLHRARSEEHFVTALQTLAPDVVVIGTEEGRRWLYPDIYRVLSANSWSVVDFPGHQVFLLDNTLAFPIDVTASQELSPVIEQSRTVEGLDVSGGVQLTFPVSQVEAESIRIRFNYTCPAHSNLALGLSVFSGSSALVVQRTERPCLGADQSGSVLMAEELPELPDLTVTLDLRPADAQARVQIHDIDAGLKPRFTRQSYLDLD